MRSATVFTFLLGTALLAAACTTTGTPTATAPIAPGGGSGSGATLAPGQATPAGGGGGGGGGAANPADPCSLLTQAEVSAVLNHPVGPGSSADDPKVCGWQYPVGTAPTVQATLGIEDGAISDMCTPLNDASVTTTTLTGVGDGACFIDVPTMTSMTNLTFAKNGHTFSVQALLGPNVTSAQILDADKALALDALARL